MYTYPMDCKIHNNASFVKYTILSIIPTNIHEVIMLNVSKYWACNIVHLTMKVTFIVQVGLQ